VNECLACRFDESIKEGTEIVLNELSHIFAMICDIIFYDPGQDGAESTLIVKAIA
jgi:hypothetical protein